MVRAFGVSVVVASFVAVGCLDTSSTVDTTAYPTMLTLSPSSFRGTLTCGGSGLHRYVVTLIDVSGNDAAAAAPFSAAPTGCALPTSFALDSSVGHAFIATIDGYDRDDIAPAGPGSREMRQVGTGVRVCAKWQATCGDPPGVETPNPLRKPTTVVELTETFVTGCSNLVVGPSAACDSEGASASDAGAGEASVADGSEAEAIPADASDGHSSDANDAGTSDATQNEATLDVSQSESGLVTAPDAASDGPRVGDATPDTSSASDAAATSADATSDVADVSPAQVLGDESREGG